MNSTTVEEDLVTLITSKYDLLLIGIIFLMVKKIGEICVKGFIFMMICKIFFSKNDYINNKTYYEMCLIIFGLQLLKIVVYDM